MRLAKKIILITGGAGGIGAAAAREATRQGAVVAVADLADGMALAEEIGGLFIHHDVTSEESWAEAITKTKERFGGIDVLVNGAGVEGDLANGNPLSDFAEWKRVMAINLDGTFLGIRAVLPSMFEVGKGSIINISSVTAFIGTPFTAPYGASKAAVWQLTKSVASFAAMSGHPKVRCNSVHPGLIRTRMTDTIFQSVGSLQGISADLAEQAMLNQVPMGERGRVEDVAAGIVYLASDESGYITGSELKIDGGWTLNNPRG